MDGFPKSGIIRALRNRISRFFFAEEVPYGLALVRIMLPLAMLIPMLQRLPWVRELYSADGASVQLSTIYQRGPWLPEFSPGITVGLFVLMLFCLITSSLGWRTRLSLVCATVLFAYFSLMDAVSTITKYSVISVDAMLVLCVAHSGAVWSIDSWLANRRQQTVAWPGQPRIRHPKHAVWPARLIQLLVAFVYFGAGITKIQTAAFFSGDQMRFWMLTNVNFDNPIGESAAMMPAILIASAYVTVIWEICFLFTVWRGWWRGVMLLIGAIFHFATFLMLGLIVFPLICLSLYFAFLRERDVQVAAAMYRRWRRRSGWRPQPATFASLHAQRLLDRLPAALRLPPPVAFAVLAGLVVLLGVEAEYQQDLYMTRSAEGPPPLKEIDPAVAATMLAPAPPLREKDKFFSFDIGTFSVGGILANSKSEFTYGDIVLAQGNLNPPHEDLLVECEIVDNDNRTVHHFQQFATREMFRCDFYYRVGFETLPGDYAFVLKSSGQEIARRPFKLVGTPPSGRVLGN